MASPAYSRPEDLVRRTATRNGTRKMRKRVSELGRFQISVETSSRGGTTSWTDIGSRSPFERSEYPVRSAGGSITKRNIDLAVDIPFRASRIALPPMFVVA